MTTIDELEVLNEETPAREESMTVEQFVNIKFAELMVKQDIVNQQTHQILRQHAATLSAQNRLVNFLIKTLLANGIAVDMTELSQAMGQPVEDIAEEVGADQSDVEAQQEIEK